LLDRFHNFLENTVRIPKDVVVPEAQNSEAAFLQVGVTSLVPSIFGVQTAVRLNNKHLIEGDEVYDPGSDWYLAAELNISELP